jgi:NADPH:quinone reductase-like Zn-dependent oxidoreductase
MITMKAVQLHGYGGTDELKYEDVAIPELRPNEVLIRLTATSVNPVDWKIRSGAAKDRMPVTFPALLGRDVAGTVVKTGADVRTLKTDQKVMGMVNGSYAEYITAPAEALTVIPHGIEMEEAGALPLVTTTGAQLIQHIQPKPGDVVLVTGALGSVGPAAMYFAMLQGARVIAGVKTRQKEEAGSLAVSQVIGIDDDRR